MFYEYLTQELLRVPPCFCTKECQTRPDLLPFDLFSVSLNGLFKHIACLLFWMLGHPS